MTPLQVFYYVFCTEEMVYAELWRRDHDRKLAKEQEELIERARKNEDRNKVLGWQRDENERTRQQKAQEILEEKRMLVKT